MPKLIKKIFNGKLEDVLDLILNEHIKTEIDDINNNNAKIRLSIQTAGMKYPLHIEYKHYKKVNGDLITNRLALLSQSSTSGASLDNTISLTAHILLASRSENQS